MDHDKQRTQKACTILKDKKGAGDLAQELSAPGFNTWYKKKKIDLGSVYSMINDVIPSSQQDKGNPQT